MCHSQSHVSGGGLGNISGDSGVDRAGARKPKMKIDEAFSYLNQVKDKFPNQREKYITFLVIMMDFKRKRIDIVGVIEKVKDLFKEHPSLHLGCPASQRPSKFARTVQKFLLGRLSYC
ncbi:hypothetical protein RDI58_010644 [Solanum bulbocastanum]|uniref:Uncharacterized protein n=1 Tax=Solanum bulbocastanum TaxID=147425 RepID=A0AAN8YJP3_SOLBU